VRTKPSIDRFCEDGFVAVRDAVPASTVQDCVGAIEKELLARAVDPRDATTWSAPVVRVSCPDGPAFAAAGTSPALHEVYDTLLGIGRWIPRHGVGGTVPVRFPSGEDPGDAGWHIDGSYDVAGQWWVNVRSRGRGLLALFLFTDIGEADVPTELLIGSHLDVPPILAPFGDRGVFFGDVAQRLPATTFRRPRARATGRAGDVYLCHPFLVHRATWPHRGTRPRMIAQPSIPQYQPFELRDGGDACAVERSILRVLQGATSW
jgi:phytanoyl-CoA dioxygenase PhyH